MSDQVRRPRNRDVGAGAGGNALYGLGLIGAAIYFFEQATSVLDFVLALPKAVVWPVIVVYELLREFYG